MIEGDCCPRLDAMARLASGLVCPVVDVVDFVAPKAGFWCTLVVLARMTALTCNLLMCTIKFVAGHVVIKDRHGAPILFCMTSSAILTQGSPMLVSLFMAAKTVRWCFGVLLSFGMACLTIEPDVCALQRIVCRGVIKQILVEADDICRAAVVIRVAHFAIEGVDFGQHAMQAPRGTHVRSNVLVAGQAKPCLGLA